MAKKKKDKMTHNPQRSSGLHAGSFGVEGKPEQVFDLNGVAMTFKKQIKTKITNHK